MNVISKSVLHTDRKTHKMVCRSWLLAVVVLRPFKPAWFRIPRSTHQLEECIAGFVAHQAHQPTCHFDLFMARPNCRPYGFIDLSLDDEDGAAPGPSEATRAKRSRCESQDDDVCVIVHPVKRSVKATSAADLGDGEELQIIGDTGGQASHEWWM